MKQIAKLLKKQREARGLTQSELARKLGYTTSQFVSNWERGLSLPPPKYFKKIEKHLGFESMTLFNLVVEQKIKTLRSEAGYGK